MTNNNPNTFSDYELMRFFLNKVLKASDANLLNNNVFREHLKGLYFQANANADSDALALLDFTSAYIEIQYHSKEELTTDDLEKKSFRLTLSGNSVTFLENNYNPDYLSALNNSSSLSGDALLYPKGGDGSVVFIDLFGSDDSGDTDNIPEELEQLRADNILVNDAFLTFYVQKDLTNNIDSKISPIESICMMLQTILLY